MANRMLNEREVEAVAQELLPGCTAPMRYRITHDDFLLYVRKGRGEAQIEFALHELTLTREAFTELLRSRLPTEWQPASSIESLDLDATG